MPRRLFTALELPRVMLEISALLPARRWLLRSGWGGEGQPVMCLPGFGDGSTAILRRFLRRWGYDAALGPGPEYEPGGTGQFRGREAGAGSFVVALGRGA